MTSFTPRKAALPAATVQYRGPVTALGALEPRFNTDAIERELTARKMERDLEDLERLRQVDESRRRSEAERLREQPDQRPTGRPLTPPTGRSSRRPTSMLPDRS